MHCTRSHSKAAYREALCQAAFAGRVHFHFDDASAAHFDAARALGAPAADQHLYGCAARRASSATWCRWRATWAGIRPASTSNTSPAPPRRRRFDGAFELRLARRGLSVPVPAGVSAAQALLDHGIGALSCEQGVCGACVLPVLEERPRHRDVFLGAAEKAANRAAFHPLLLAGVAAQQLDL